MTITKNKRGMSFAHVIMTFIIETSLRPEAIKK